ncbi:MAG: hypothetical protein NT069_11895 [Planctomycetota bacterium]|nr:hypothetical protein [Planctomycetota bacterium]
MLLDPDGSYLRRRDEHEVGATFIAATKASMSTGLWSTVQQRFP